MAINVPNNDQMLSQLSAVVGGVLANKMATEQATAQRGHEFQLAQLNNQNQMAMITKDYEMRKQLGDEQRKAMLEALPQQLQAWGLNMQDMLPKEEKPANWMEHYGSRIAGGAAIGGGIGLAGAGVGAIPGALIGGAAGLIEAGGAHLLSGIGKEDKEAKKKSELALRQMQTIAALNQMMGMNQMAPGL